MLGRALRQSAQRSFSKSLAAMSASKSIVRVRLVLFDAFGKLTPIRPLRQLKAEDTLCTPRIPIHEQWVSRYAAVKSCCPSRYYDEAIKSGISSALISPQSVRRAFKPGRIVSYLLFLFKGVRIVSIHRDE